jgi:hypothetical protein
MRKLIPPTIVIAIIAALGAVAAASSGATTATRITCKSTEYNPTPAQASGFVVGFTKCSQQLGDGVISATYRSTFNPTTGAGTANGKWTKWLLNGTVHGRYDETFQFTSNTIATYKLAITWTGGSGAYSSVKGTGTEHCTTTDGGATQTCQSVADVTGL